MERRVDNSTPPHLYPLPQDGGEGRVRGRKGSISLDGWSNCFYNGGDTNSPTTAEHLDASLPANPLKVVDHLSEEQNPGCANGVAQCNGATRWIDPGI